MIHNIKSLNYIVSGKTEKIINIDVENQDNGKIVNWSFIPDENSDSNSNASFVLDYNTHRLLKYPSVSDSSKKDSENNHRIVYDLFDFKDVAVKSDFSDSNFNCVYGPQLSANPIGFCQGSEANAFGMTEEITNSPIIANTNLRDIRVDRDNGKRTALYWKYVLKDGDQDIYTYIPLDKLSVDSYYTYLSSGNPALSVDRFDKLFSPETDMLGIPKNYLYEFYLSNIKSSGPKYNNFNEGELFGNVFSGKNMYNGKYSMELNIENNGENNEQKKSAGGRRYVGIGSVGGHVFLKYYDDVKRLENSKVEHKKDGLSFVKCNETIDSNGEKYQKVEVLDSINRFVSKSNHKSNLYSIRISKLGLVNHESLLGKLSEIKSDIEKNVRMIAEKLAPAHTQLFKVYVEDN